MLEHSAEIGQIAVALATAQGKFGKIVKDTANTFFKSKYAPLSTVIEGIRKPLAESKIAVVQHVEFSDGLCNVTTMLLHESGQWLKGIISLPVGKMDAQGVGSASTYGRRYGLSAFVNVAADDDDDGNAASKPEDTKPDETKLVQEKVKAIESAVSLPELQKIYKEAYKWAFDRNDKSSVAMFVAAKDGRQKTLNSPLNVAAAKALEATRGDAHEGD